MQDCMTDARSILQDTDATSYRVSELDLLRFGNFALGEIALRRPDLFSTFGEIGPLTANETLQSAPAGALRLMEIIRVKGGRVVKECAMDDLDQFNVNWHSVPGATPVNWVRHPRDPVKFYVSPPPPQGTTLIGQWAASPTILVAQAPLPIPDAYAPVISDYMVWRAESRDDEFVSAPRATLFLAAFNASLGISAKTKATADSDVGNRDIQKQLAAQAQNTTYPQQAAPAAATPALEY